MNAKPIQSFALILLLITPISALARLPIQHDREPMPRPEPASPPPPRLIGPYDCTNGCTVGFPRPDPLTIKTILDKIDSFNRGRFNREWVRIGDVIVVCNGAACVHYRVTQGGETQYLGEKIEHQRNTPPARGGGGGGGGGARIGGGSPGGSPGFGRGGGRGGGGRVTIGPITNPRIR